MKFGMVNKLKIVNRFLLHTSHRNKTHLVEVTCKINIKLDNVKGGENGKESKDFIRT